MLTISAPLLVFYAKDIAKNQGISCHRLLPRYGIHHNKGGSPQHGSKGNDGLNSPDLVGHFTQDKSANLSHNSRHDIKANRYTNCERHNLFTIHPVTSLGFVSMFLA